MSELNQMDCEEFAEVAAELALGVLTGRERAEALAHLERCEGCRENVRQLTSMGEELLGLLPASEPPPGFETRVLDRIGLTTPDRRTGRIGIPRRVLAAAVVAGVAAAGAGGWGLRGATTPTALSPLSSAAFVSTAHQAAGRIFTYSGNPGWLYMYVDLGTADSTVICQLVGGDGQVSTVGSFQLSHGYGAWGSLAPARDGSLAGARLVTADGTVLATASFAK